MFKSSLLHSACNYVNWCEQNSVVTVTAGYTPTHIYPQTSLIKKKLTSYRLLSGWPTIGKTVKCIPEY